MSDKIRVNIKPNHPDFIIPARSTSGSAGYDVRIPEDFNLKFGRQVVDLGFSLSMDPNLCLSIRPRSGHSSKGLLVYDQEDSEHRINADVCLGLVDSDYRGNIGVIIKNYSLKFLMYKLMGKKFRFKKHQILAQMVFEVVPNVSLNVVDKLENSIRGIRGFGEVDHE